MNKSIDIAPNYETEGFPQRRFLFYFLILWLLTKLYHYPFMNCPAYDHHKELINALANHLRANAHTFPGLDCYDVSKPPKVENPDRNYFEIAMDLYLEHENEKDKEARNFIFSDGRIRDALTMYEEAKAMT